MQLVKINGKEAALTWDFEQAQAVIDLVVMAAGERGGSIIAYVGEPEEASKENLDGQCLECGLIWNSGILEGAEEGTCPICGSELVDGQAE